MKNRIVQVREHLNMSQEEFGKKVNLSRNYISLLENGNRNLADRTLKDICRIFNVNEKWLRTGEGEMFLPVEDDVAEYVSELLEDEDNPFYDIIKAIMRTYLELDEKNKDIFKSFAKSLADNIKEEGRD